MALFSRAHQAISRRTFVLAGLMALPFPILLTRIFYLQYVAGARYRQLAEKNRLNIRPIRPPRGNLLDRYGQMIAQDKPAFRLVMIREQCPNPKEVLQRLSRLIPLSKKAQEKTLEEASHRASFTPVTVAKTLPFDDMARVQANQPDLPGIDLQTVPLRHYENGELVGHLTGYVGRSESYRPAGGDMRWSPDFPVGRQGLEKLYEERLSGVPGLLQSEVNAQRRPIRQVDKQEARPGEDITLSLDTRLQQAAWKALGKNVGACVVMDVKSGGLLACASKPGIDPNMFSEGLSKDDWQALINNPGNPLLNRAFQGVYSPGSTFKAIVALAALEEGVTTPEETMMCRGKIKLGNREFNCWKKHHRVNLQSSLKGSCDIYFYEMARRLGVDTISRYAHAFGLGEITGMGIPEKEGLVPTRAWKKHAKREAWTQGEDLITGIGQGFLLTTPLQLAQMCARLAGGTNVSPVILREHEGIYPTTELKFKPENLELVRQGLYDVMHVPGGTAYYRRPKGFTMGGKTGTVQVISQRIEDDVDMSSVPYKRRPHGIFIGFAPFDNPRFAVSVVVEHGGSGSGAAAPVAVEVLNEAMVSVSA